MQFLDYILTPPAIFIVRTSSYIIDIFRSAGLVGSGFSGLPFVFILGIVCGAALSIPAFLVSSLLKESRLRKSLRKFAFWTMVIGVAFDISRALSFVWLGLVGNNLEYQRESIKTENQSIDQSIRTYVTINSITVKQVAPAFRMFGHPNFKLPVIEWNLTVNKEGYYSFFPQNKTAELYGYHMVTDDFITHLSVGNQLVKTHSIETMDGYCEQKKLPIDIYYNSTYRKVYGDSYPHTFHDGLDEERSFPVVDKESIPIQCIEY